MAKKNGLGRGFDSLFQQNAEDENVTTLRLSQIEPNRDQPRKEFDEESLSQLADSISKYGVLQPLVVRPIPAGDYQLVAGERRWRACKIAGVTEVPVIIKDLTDNEAMEIAMIENLQREDLNPIEEAAGYKYLMVNFDMTQEMVAERCGKSRSAIANSIRLLLLPDDILELIKIGSLTPGHGKAILSIDDEALREEAVRMAQNGCTVRELEKLARNAKKQGKNQVKPEAKDLNYYKEAELSLKNELNRKVKIKSTTKGGSLIIDFFDKDDLSTFLKKYFNN